MEDNIIFICETCGEEYDLPEEHNEECPICGQDTLIPLE